jgi:hypothetical protein
MHTGLMSAQCEVAAEPPAAPACHAYSGRYEAYPEAGLVVHHISQSNIAEEEGSRVVRSYEIAAGRLILRFPGTGLEHGPGATDEMSGCLILEREER